MFWASLHVVPAAWNGQLIAVYALNALFAALVVAVGYGVTRSLRAAAACCAALLIFAAVKPAVFSSDWMPYLLVMPYLAFLVATASVAAGNLRSETECDVLERLHRVVQGERRRVATALFQDNRSASVCIVVDDNDFCGQQVLMSQVIQDGREDRRHLESHFGAWVICTEHMWPFQVTALDQNGVVLDSVPYK